MNIRKITLCDEMVKLREILDAKGIEWTDASTIESDVWLRVQRDKWLQHIWWLQSNT